MAHTKNPGKGKFDIAITALLFFCFIFANIYSIRKVSIYATELFFYDKLLVAYQTGGLGGLNNEVGRIIFQEDAPRQVKLAEIFKENLKSLDEPGEFLKSAVEKRKKEIDLYRNLRDVAFACIGLLILLRVMMKRRR